MSWGRNDPGFPPSPDPDRCHHMGMLDVEDDQEWCPDCGYSRRRRAYLPSDMPNLRPPTNTEDDEVPW